ncbi:MAG: CYTH domain-containing protein [Bacteroidales bacterium]|nr:CYTH domain-containing protein [Bacteroidales bacterium]MBD5206565.1 CYTH domain-containing protein [Bacteroidales bacterium]MBD5224103.1 CYTH domain-containing protein [Bacteroidales bacterium]MBD5301865.1 CYTH domain-containing protein [Bacteroides sp.]
MAVEIERKFLVNSHDYRNMASACHTIVQGYLSKEPERTVRIRIKDDKGFITVKGKTIGCKRLEFEYEIPLDDAKDMLKLCLSPILEKKRYIVNYCGFKWEIDEFEGYLAPLVMAEVELPDESLPLQLPAFIGEEVTGNPKYYNSNL